jgi:hypothetical protein
MLACGFLIPEAGSHPGDSPVASSRIVATTGKGTQPLDINHRGGL